MSHHKLSPMASLLVAEDDPDDRVILESALKDCAVEECISFVSDGESLLKTLRGQAPPPPDSPEADPSWLVLLDLNLPGLDGREALRRMKADPKLRAIPVVVLTTSENPADIELSYELGASAYFTKPIAYGELLEWTRAFKRYWLELAVLPGG